MNHKCCECNIEITDADYDFFNNCCMCGKSAFCKKCSIKKRVKGNCTEEGESHYDCCYYYYYENGNCDHEDEKEDQYLFNCCVKYGCLICSKCDDPGSTASVSSEECKNDERIEILEKKVENLDRDVFHRLRDIDLQKMTNNSLRNQIDELKIQIEVIHDILRKCTSEKNNKKKSVQ